MVEAESFDGVSQPQWPRQQRSAARPFLGIHFACCHVYARIYRTADGTRYVGHCPKCCRRIEFRVDAGGTDQRFFSAY